MINKNKKFAGIFIVAGVLITTSILYANVTSELKSPQEEHHQLVHPPTATNNSYAIAIDGDEVYILKGDSLLVLDRKTLKTKQSTSTDFNEVKPVKRSPAAMAVPVIE